MNAAWTMEVDPADLAGCAWQSLAQRACASTLQAHGTRISYSRKVFIPLTRLCRDVCHYCTFATSPRKLEKPYLEPDDVLAIARSGVRAGCKEALFTLGDKPELRYGSARRALERLGFPSTLAYLEAMCERVLRETGLLPHVNPGIMTRDDIARLRRVSASQGLMLESIAVRLCDPGGPHHGSPDKHPERRLETLRLAGELGVPFTTGILIGIGETRAERIEAFLAIRELQQRYGHIQEVIVQNFRAKPDTRLAHAPEPSLEELLWTIAAARLVLGPEMNIQAPPNLSAPVHARLIEAGINDWGGISPITPDHVNPEAPWPQIEVLERECAQAGRQLTERLALYPQFALEPQRWLDASLRPHVLKLIDGEGCARTDGWQPGLAGALPHKRPVLRADAPVAEDLRILVERAASGARLEAGEIVRLFGARGEEVEWLCAEADRLRRAVCGDEVTYVVNRNINYTNVCGYHCRFCAFSKGTPQRGFRGAAYDLSLDEVVRRAREAWDRGATEVCMQGGIHPAYTGATYLALVEAVKAAVPQMHVHAFSPLEVWQGARTLGLTLGQYLRRLVDVGLDSLPGTAAEILDDEVRAVICPDKLTTAEWLEVVATAHECGLPTTTTIMFGHVEQPIHWARHLLHVRDLQQRTGGFTEFVPLPFVAMEAPLYRKGLARSGPTLREALLMHAVARIVLHPGIRNIQTSWVKMGAEGARMALASGANDLGGTLMNESISRAAGTQHGQELPPAAMDELIRSAARTPRQRNMRYERVSVDRTASSYAAEPLAPVVQTPAAERLRKTSPVV